MGYFFQSRGESDKDSGMRRKLGGWRGKFEPTEMTLLMIVGPFTSRLAIVIFSETIISHYSAYEVDWTKFEAGNTTVGLKNPASEPESVSGQSWCTWTGWEKDTRKLGRVSLGRAANSIAGKCPPISEDDVTQMVLLSNLRSEIINLHMRIEVMLETHLIMNWGNVRRCGGLTGRRTSWRGDCLCLRLRERPKSKTMRERSELRYLPLRDSQAQRWGRCPGCTT